jgi:hypothetical protein
MLFGEIDANPLINMQSIHDLEFAFRRAVFIKTQGMSVQDARNAPHQSKGRNVRFPGSSLAAEELGVSRSHLHRVLIGERSSPPLRSRWQAWLKSHPEFAALQPSDRPA